MINPEIIQDISLLYELALSVGNSLDLQKNCTAFLSILMRRKDLSFASLWLNTNSLPEAMEEAGFRAVFAHPGFRMIDTFIPASHPLIPRLGEKNILLFDLGSEDIQELIWEKDIPESGTLCVFKLGELGFLKMYAFHHKESIRYQQWYKLSNVMEQFKQSIRACLSQEKLIKEIEERRLIEKQLRESKEIEEQFFANMSHEIRTPINGMLGMMNLMLATDLTPEQRQYISNMKLSGKTLLAILNDILDYSKIQQGKIGLETIRFDLLAQIQSVQAAAQGRASGKKLDIILEVGEGTPQFVKGDPVRFDQILNNLVSNAIKFTNEGSIKIQTEVLQKKDKQVRLKFLVTDTGIGISEDKLTSIFSNFVQAEQDTTRKYGGTGLGLAIVKQLVEIMGGSIAVESQLGEGSTFSFVLSYELPLNQTVQKKKKDIKETLSNKALKGYKILIVEDTKMNQKVASMMLHRWGAEWKIAENGLEAFEMCKEEDFDLILMDLQMPVMSGFEASKKIRAELQAPISKVPIIALTAALRDYVKENVLDSGMDSYIIKPFEPDNLLAVIRFYIQKRSGMAAPLEKEEKITLRKIGIDTSYLQEIAQGDHKFVRDMLELFKDQAPFELKNLHKHLEEKDWHIVGQQAHKLKYPYAAVGRNDLRLVLAGIEGETSTINPSYDKIKDDFELIQQHTEKILKEIEEWFANHPSPVSE
ncbi:MAG: ATP-binding protein [Bacteroidota bacterium]